MRTDGLDESSESTRSSSDWCAPYAGCASRSVACRSARTCAIVHARPSCAMSDTTSNTHCRISVSGCAPAAAASHTTSSRARAGAVAGSAARRCRSTGASTAVWKPAPSSRASSRTSAVAPSSALPSHAGARSATRNSAGSSSRAVHATDRRAAMLPSLSSSLPSVVPSSRLSSGCARTKSPRSATYASFSSRETHTEAPLVLLLLLLLALGSDVADVAVVAPAMQAGAGHPGAT